MSAAPSLYTRLGGQEGIDRLVLAYLQALQSLPQAQPLCHCYGRGFDHYHQRMREYLSGFLGGPALYLHNHGLPLLRENHQNIPISAALRDQWYECMMTAVRQCIDDEALRKELGAVFWTMADSLRNC